MMKKQLILVCCSLFAMGVGISLNASAGAKGGNCTTACAQQRFQCTMRHSDPADCSQQYQVCVQDCRAD